MKTSTKRRPRIPKGDPLRKAIDAAARRTASDTTETLRVAVQIVSLLKSFPPEARDRIMRAASVLAEVLE